jgi:hypothetical protein
VASVVSILVLLFSQGLAQPPDSLWSRTFGGSDFDECHFAAQTSDGDYILAGHPGSFGAGYDDFWLVKTGPDFVLTAPQGLVVCVDEDSLRLAW